MPIICHEFECVNVNFKGSHMKFDDSFPKRISIARAAMGLTQGQLADKVGIVRRQIAAYEAGDSKPRDAVLRNLAATLGTTTEWLAIGVGEGPDVSSIQRTVTVREIPVFSHLSNSYPKGGKFPSDITPIDFIPAPLCAGNNAFALVVTGHSMTSSSGISFPDGYTVCFDPDIQAKPGDFVLCCNGFETTFKQLIRDQGHFYLKPLNPAYPMLEISDDMEIIAVAIHAQIDLLKTPLHSIRDSENTLDEAEDFIAENARTEKELLYLKLKEIEEKLNFLLDSRDNKKPT
ncbi:helix-turn-helix domain-containing protein [Escherichia coli]|nr:helix-turn-helix domain-containing protein [Escherichia coli O109]EGD6076594.1 helix-turn-helix domain-containing protein [Escherichia coli]MCI5447631.1 helix-turn-helix domain-containing protein [Escherichia coli]MXC58928.1 helix-turn-helix domain-containing protein [Escherichia coli]TEW26930.1 helix-turn-helix domain-containing protein [Escherichia coli]